MDIGSVTLREVKSGRGEISYDIPYMWNLKRNDTNELTYKTDSRDFENELMVANGKRDS